MRNGARGLAVAVKDDLFFEKRNVAKVRWLHRKGRATAEDVLAATKRLLEKQTALNEYAAKRYGLTAVTGRISRKGGR